MLKIEIDSNTKSVLNVYWNNEIVLISGQKTRSFLEVVIKKLLNNQKTFTMNEFFLSIGESIPDDKYWQESNRARIRFISKSLVKFLKLSSNPFPMKNGIISIELPYEIVLIELSQEIVQVSLRGKIDQRMIDITKLTQKLIDMEQDVSLKYIKSFLDILAINE